MRSRSIWNFEELFLRVRENRSTRRKNLAEQGRELATKLNPKMASTPGFGPHLWVASALTTAPPLRSVALFPMRKRSLCIAVGRMSKNVLGD